MDTNDIKYWAYDPMEGDIIFYDNIEDRDVFVEYLIEECKNNEDGMWEEDMLYSIKIGEGIETHHIVQKDVKLRCDQTIDEDNYDQDGLFWSDYEFFCDFKMEKL